MEPREPYGPALLDLARADITTTLAATGRQVPQDVAEHAADLLAAFWAYGVRHGVQPEDWRAVASLPTICLDAMAMVERRRRGEWGKR